ncbi:MAG: hypothetical protein M2R45_02885 [Verrucomicrobia subdivision 3 bacterium]|nr:hypothetical protein [Limisphaerales bacterium]MCS1414737.1 hypothetical protein [Limisphaerales bacterium]
MKFLWLTALLCVLCVSKSEAQSVLESTRSVVEKWIEARKTIAEIRSDWIVEKEILEQSIAAFERELKSLNTQLEQVDSGSNQTDKELAEVQREKGALRLASDELKVSVGKLEAKLRGLAPGFPAPVTEKIEPLFNRIPEDPEETTLGLSSRLQNIVGILNELDKFNGSLSVVSELRKTEAGAEVQTRVMYVGLGQAYFIDKTGEFCGYGISSPSGWTWTVQQEMGPAIAKAIGVYENSEPATFVGLPMTVK